MKLVLPVFLFPILCLSIAYSQVKLDSGLVAYYPFNGTANDASGNGNNAVFNSATLTSDRSGDANKAYLFDGSSSYIQIPNSSILNTGSQISLCVYVKINGFYSGPCHANDIINKGQYYDNQNFYLLRFSDAYTNGGDCFSTVDTIHQTFQAIGVPVSSPGPPYIATNQWYSLIYTYDGATAKLFVDGILLAQNSVSGLSFNNSDDLFLGRLYNPSNPSTFQYWFNGVMDEVRIYSRAINLQEINELNTIQQNSLGNTATGIEALGKNTTGYNNTADGYQALYNNTTGYTNTATGYSALYFNTTGNNNTASGVSSLYNNTIGTKNTAGGIQSLFNNTTGNHNTASGFNALYNNTTANFNTATGNYSLQNNTTGSSNTAIGYSAGGAFNYTNSTFIGFRATTSLPNLTNVTVVGNGASATASNQVRIGNSSVTSIGGKVGWTTLSDGRYKRNIKEDVPGLAFINALRAVTYTLDIDGLDKELKGGDIQIIGEASIKPEGEELKAKKENSKITYTGFVAQEVEKAAKKLKYDFSGVDAPKNNDDLYGLRYSEFVVPLVKAVQELSKKNDELAIKAEKVDELEKELTELKQMVLELKGGGVNINGTTSAYLSSSYLEQSVPNPVKGNTTVRYHLPGNAINAKVVITDIKGSAIKSITVKGGEGQAIINCAGMAAGTYNYSLWTNGTKVDTKQMVIFN